jgi:DNA-binding winged helix-turn-helix (wHTH) protein
MQAPKRTDFSHWAINLDHYSLKNENEEEIFVEPRLLKLLNFLHTNANKVVKRNEIVDHVWGDVIVAEESLSKAIFDLRKFLNDNFSDTPQILTIRKVGYKLELKEKVPPTPRYRVLLLTLKVLGSIFILAFLLSLIIRAIRYEN